MKNTFKLSLSLFIMLILLTTSIYAANLPNRVLPFMSRGPDVVEVQKALNITGAKLTVDGVYGQATKNAVLNFQKKYSSLSNDGIYGPSTKTVLEKALGAGEDNSGGGSQQPPTVTGTLPNRVLPFMSRGPDVVQVQNALNKTGARLVADGVYGQATKNAVLNFQKKYSSLSNDGIYGPSTRVVLEKALAGGGGDNPQVPVPTGKIAYLTFDDGPSSNITPRILKTLNDYNVKATFFMLGNMTEKNPSLVKQVQVNGHSIGNHTYSHDYSYIYANVNNFLGEVDKTDRIFKNILGNGFNSKLFRFPGGSFESKKAPYRDAVKAKGYNYYDWNVLNGDSESNNIPAWKLVNRIKETTRGQKEIVVLMHDASTKSTTADALPEIIEYLKGQGYTFKTLNQ